MWVPPEIKDPILQHAPTRKSVACFGAVSLVTGQFVRMMCAIFNAATFLRFLKRLLRQKTSGQRMILVLDNARYHHALAPGHVLAPPCPGSAAAVSATLQPATRPDRASLETGPAPGDAQPLLRNPSRSAESCHRLFQSLAPTEHSVAPPMLHYLRRCV
jgi:hypothetical protein